MRTPLVDRRDFLKAAGTTFLASLSPRASAMVLLTDAVYATAFQRRDGAYGAAILSEDGQILHTVALPDRGHDVTFDPVTRRSVVFARQPGTFATIFDHTGQSQPLTIGSVEGRHFYGHGAFSPDGKLLYATENDFDNAAGMIGVYDATDDFRRVGEFPTHGVGPHEVLLLDDGRTLVIANGGIETHPDFGRAKLNIPSMKPSLVFVDRVSGALVERHELVADLHKLSIRHMDTDASGAVWFGCQYEGPKSERPLLVGSVRRGEELNLLEMEDDVIAGFRNYIGSVAANREEGFVAVSSPEGNCFAVIDAAKRAVVSTRTLTEVCGLAPDIDGFRATTGTGETLGPDGAARSDPDYVWDNHLTRIF